LNPSLNYFKSYTNGLGQEEIIGIIWLL